MSRGLKRVFLVHTLVSFIFGVVLFVITGTWARVADWGPFDPAMTRVYGAALMAIGLSSWLGYHASRWEEVRIIVLMEIAFTVLSAVGILYELLFADAGSSAWISFLFYVGFGLVWIFYYRRGQTEPAESRG
jgi:hypothetical protein